VVTTVQSPFREGSKVLISQEVRKFLFLSFRRKPESSVFKELKSDWTPDFTGVMGFCEITKGFPRKDDLSESPEERGVFSPPGTPRDIARKGL
jgi:hypothetical protein